ncbi:MAG: UPF0158 family protein [Desulfobacterales bacterium]|jgi:hypothetical protein|nr:UPF0158 family protein [Desulfobacterales bacterium]
MPIKFSDIEDAFFFVSMGEMYMNSAILCIKTGQVLYISDFGDSDELPEDIDDDLDKYIEIPHKNELNLGKPLVLEFSAMHLPDNLEKVNSFFHKKGAYSKFKNLLEAKGLLDKWYAFEKEEQNKALREWCKDNDINIEG